jgi:hypothetical protein
MRDPILDALLCCVVLCCTDELYCVVLQLGKLAIYLNNY